MEKTHSPKQKMTDTSMNATCQEVLQEHILTGVNVRVTVSHQTAYLRQENTEESSERDLCGEKTDRRVVVIDYILKGC